jgi:alpha-tubulin suppressor-like RCC1 family protein
VVNTVVDTTNVVSVSHNGSVGCAVLSDGNVKCWGAQSLRPTFFPGLSDVASVAEGAGHSCAVGFDGSISCWGNNSFGALGDGTTVRRESPMPVPGLTNIVAASASGHTCAVRAAGTVACWGFNASGQLGDGTTTNRSTPVTVSGLSNVVAIATGSSHSCALRGDGTVACWGFNGEGQLGPNPTPSSDSLALTPVTVDGLSDIVEIKAGGAHTCFLRRAGTVACVGNNRYGQTGAGPSQLTHKNPVTVVGLTDVVTIAAGGNHSCALRVDGSVACWGENFYLQVGAANIGVGERFIVYSPLTVADVSAITTPTTTTTTTTLSSSTTSSTTVVRSNPIITGSPTIGSTLTCQEGSGGPYVRWIGVRPPDRLVGFGQVRTDQVLKESNPQYPPFDRSYTLQPSDAGKTIWCAQFTGIEGRATGSNPITIAPGSFAVTA